MMGTLLSPERTIMVVPGGVCCPGTVVVVSFSRHDLAHIPVGAVVVLVFGVCGGGCGLVVG